MCKVVIVQYVCPHYRVPFFRELAKKVNLILLHGKGENRGSYQNAIDITGFAHKKLFLIALNFYIRDSYIRLFWFPTLLFHLYKLKPEVIITEGFTNLINNIFLWIYSKVFNIPLIIWDSGRVKTKPMSFLRKIMEPLNIFLLKQCNAIIAYGTIAKDYFISIGADSEKIFIAQNTIDVETCIRETERVEANLSMIKKVRKKLSLDNKKVILFVGALEKMKKIENLIAVFGELKRKISDVSLLIIGDGSYKEKLVNFVQSQKIRDCIFLGKITDGAGVYFLISDIFVLPGRGGLAINQAMAYGKTIIVKEGDGTEIDLIKHGLNGFIIKNICELKDLLMSLLNNELQLKKMGKESLKIIKKFKLENMVKKFVETIEYVTE